MQDRPETEAETLEDSILKAFDEVEGRSEDDGDNEPETPEEPEAEETAEEAESDEEEPEQSDDEDDPEEGADDDGEALAAPEHWSADDKAAFDALPDDIKPMWLEKSKSLESGYQEKFQALADERKQIERYKSLDSAFEPYREKLALEGVSEAQAVQRLMAAQTYLERDPVQAIGWLAKSYGVDLTQFAPQQASAEDEFDDPTITPLKQKIADLEAREANRMQSAQMQQRQALMGEIAAFRDAATEDGSPAHPHFDSVRTHMGALMQAEPSLTLEAAYEQAVWANPEVRASLIKAQEAEAAKARETARKDEVKKAKKAGKTKSASRSSPSEPKPAASHREELERQFEAAGM